MTTRADMPESFRAQLDARLARPLLLDARHFDGVRALAGFRPREAMLSSSDEMPVEGPQEEPTEYALVGDLAIVSIEGPLAQRAWSCWMFSGDGYDAILSRTRQALADPRARALVLRIDSPGGEAAGNIECARALRAAIEASGKPCVAYADELIASAAYALATAADEIVTPDTGTLGSVGVIAAVVDRSEQLAAEGVAVHFITSGARKADGHSEAPLSDDARAAIQAEVDHLADVFCALVAQRRGMSLDAVKALEAGVRLGSQAVAAGLADRVGTLDDAMTLARSRAATRTRTKMIEAVKAALGMSADSTEEQLVARVTALRALQGKHETAEAAAGELAALRVQVAEIPALRTALAEAQGKASAEARERKLDAAVRRGALTREATDARWQLAQSLTDAQLDAYLATLAPQGAKVEPKKQPSAGAAAAGIQLTAEEIAIAKTMGNDLEVVLAAKREHAARLGLATTLEPAPTAEDND